MNSGFKLSAIFLAAGLVVSSQAVVVMDQIGASASDLPAAGTGFLSQVFEAGNAQFSTAAIDDFAVTSGQLSLTQVQAVVIGMNGQFNFQNFGNVQSWSVQIYSSLNAAASSLTGDVGSVTLAPGGVTLNTGYASGISNSALLTLPVSINLPSAGTYWVGVTGRMDNSAGQVGIYESAFAAGYPKGANAYQVNPGGGFGLTDNRVNQGVDLTYRVNAVPEPASMAALALGAAALLRRRRKA